jgi:hypothetical protein
VHEFIGHYVALEGRLWKTLWLLLFKPGMLTLEYLRGRRIRYVEPLRLYLTLSLIFFAVLKYGEHVGIHFGDGHQPAASAAQHAGPARHAGGAKGDNEAAPAESAVGVPAPVPTTPAPSKSAELIREDRPDEFREGTNDVREFVGRYNKHWADRLTAFAGMSQAERGELITEAFYHYAPYAVFLMMPLFALYLKILYLGSGRRYGEHLLFALHTNGFAYLALTLWLVAPSFYGMGLVKFLLWLWVAFYLPVAMRRVYHGGRLVTGLRWIVLMALHLLTVTLAIAAAVAFGVVH